MLTYTAPHKENTRQKYDRKRTAFTKAVFSDCIRSLLIDLGRDFNFGLVLCSSLVTLQVQGIKFQVWKQNILRSSINR
jgi:hypothetical protein